MDWLSELQQRFGAKGKILICLEQSRGALIYHLMGYEFLELYGGSSVKCGRLNLARGIRGALGRLTATDVHCNDRASR
jgi:hypothetical protein